MERYKDVEIDVKLTIHSMGYELKPEKDEENKL